MIQPPIYTQIQIGHYEITTDFIVVVTCETVDFPKETRSGIVTNRNSFN